jgi:hypothetical protein
MQDNPTLLLQVITTPHVVVSCKEVHFYSSVGKFTDFTQKTSKTLRNYGLVLKPEIKHVSKQIDCLCMILDVVKKVDKTTLLGSTMLYGT